MPRGWIRLQRLKDPFVQPTYSSTSVPIPTPALLQHNPGYMPGVLKVNRVALLHVTLRPGGIIINRGRVAGQRWTSAQQARHCVGVPRQGRERVVSCKQQDV